MGFTNRIIFRADGNSQIGLGHVIRSLALATILKPDFKCLFAIQAATPSLNNQLQEACTQIINLPETKDYLKEAAFLVEQILTESDIVVLDGYLFDTAYQEQIKKKCFKLVCIDDIHAFPFVADVVINQAGGLTQQQYRATPETRFCLGPNYALLRQPFLMAAQQTREFLGVSRIFINMGGADPENHTYKIVSNLSKNHPALQLEVVTGGAYQFLPELEALEKTTANIHLYQQLSAEEICSLMQQCDAAVIPPSSVSYEWCSIQGALFLHQTADNQTNLGNFLIKEGLAFAFTDFQEIITHPDLLTLRKEQVKKQQHYFDGRSANRLRNIFYQFVFEAGVKLRPATADDTLILYDWINDPAVRANSFNPDAIPLEVHKIWFKNKVAAANCVILIVEVEDQKAGMIRYDIRDKIATISYLLQANFRGKGLGSLVLQKGTEYIQTLSPSLIKLVGHVQKENLASVNSFYKAGFVVSQTIPAAIPNALAFEKYLN
ncbi:UDP-2,4-diacetamido-2,4,6-trideoxy-beta-L-altropyranose hydrolase [Adhaeribacter aquaticus]|uniref:UDP-2,4-diacetamido-2,4, 6-trideoxy-beta-L-altropyranose hydrolase n=1 Tax=Adhaeribacter aquaticus TaxID=299567 RepID=UPI000688B8D0|nr:UDP-2,4-diacetamido-2,4,6-trideoxy-beta-L-altropyranose hydrolase [Adhaeribacter aquaticus]